MLLTLKKPLIFGLSFALLFSSCQKEPTNTIDSSVLDNRLEELLIENSSGEGLSAFVLPESSDYSSIPQDANNSISNSKVELGKLLFHETAIGINAHNVDGIGTYSCASCHHAPGGFQACVPQGIGEGGAGFGVHGEQRNIANGYSDDEIDVQPLRTPSAMNAAFQKNMLWNGQFGANGVNVGTEANWTEETPKAVNHLGYDGVEIQAIAGLEVHRMKISTELTETYPEYDGLFRAAFPDLPEEERVNAETAGLAIAAYERVVLANKAPFQKWLKGNKLAMTDDEKLGAILFFGKGQCGTCHSGPALNSMDFHALGMGDLETGNYGSVFMVDNQDPAHLGRGGFTGNPADNYKFKVPQLYNLKDSPFYGHGASFRSIEDVVRYKNDASAENSKVADAQLSHHFRPLHLTEVEIDKISEFIEYALYDPELERYVPESLPSGNCFPNNDLDSRADLGCD